MPRTGGRHGERGTHWINHENYQGQAAHRQDIGREQGGTCSAAQGAQGVGLKQRQILPP